MQTEASKQADKIGGVTKITDNSADNKKVSVTLSYVSSIPEHFFYLLQNKNFSLHRKRKVIIGVWGMQGELEKQGSKGNFTY